MNSAKVLYPSLVKGFINKEVESDHDFLPELLVNDSVKNTKVLTTIIHELENCDEFWFSVAFITTSGVASIINTLLELKTDKRIKGKIVTSRYLNFTQPLALERLLYNFPNIELRIVEQGDFHAKGYLFRKNNTYNLIIGSSNLTAAALSKNKEWNLKVTAKDNSYLMQMALKQFQYEFQNATIVTADWLLNYSVLYAQVKILNTRIEEVEEKTKEIKPNLMQKEALENLKKLRQGGTDKALLISATGTGKTYLSAFDVAEFDSKSCLFVVHRRNIAEAALKTFKVVHGKDKTYGLYSGEIREIEADFLFTTIQTITRDEHLNKFTSDHFDYIIIDETHRAGADSYKKVMNYFKPKFMLGMTATPERTDGFDVFSLFNHNIAYEIRLNKALKENMLTDFHYYGVQDISVDGMVISDKSDFRYLHAKERVNHIITTIKKYGTDNGEVNGLVFCSRQKECEELSRAFNMWGFKTIALTGESSEEQRKKSITRLESSGEKSLDYIFTVDIFNEGVDMPRVNQVVMLRPTSSAIIFVQQLGRGLRKADNKEYVTVIDFIGNYENNYLIPIALFGDTTYNKDTLRKLISNGSRMIPGASTINFDRITKEKIYSSIESTNLMLKKKLDRDYDLLKYRLGRFPLMMDFIKYESRDPIHYVKYKNQSFYAFSAQKEEKLRGLISGDALLLLKYLSKEVNNSIRVEESIILKQILTKGHSSYELLEEEILDRFKYRINHTIFNSAINNLNLKFNTEKHNNQLRTLQEIYSFKIVANINNKVYPDSSLKEFVKNKTFTQYLEDNIEYSIAKFSKEFHFENYVEGFVRYRKYSRKDCFRILNWDTEPLMQNVGGYMFHPRELNCPIFVNYHKADNITDTTKYEDRFLDSSTIVYMSKNKRKISSPDVRKFKEALQRNIRLPLLVKKDNAEGDDFYYLGDVKPKTESFLETTIGEKKVAIVKMTFTLDKPVERSLYDYITEGKEIKSYQFVDTDERMVADED